MNIFLIFVLGFLLWAEPATPKLRDASFSSGAQIKVEVADDHESRYRGLMGRTQLPEHQGMLFIFDFPHRLSFWMKNTYLPLSIAFLDSERKVREIMDMKAQNMMERDEDLQNYMTSCECKYALEMNQGWFKKNKVKVGDRLDLRPE